MSRLDAASFWLPPRELETTFKRLRLMGMNSLSDADLEMRILAVFADKPRSGTPPKFTPEVIVKIIALACEPPSDSGLAISHWSTSELAREAIKRGIVASISPRQVGRFLAKRT